MTDHKNEMENRIKLVEIKMHETARAAATSDDATTTFRLWFCLCQHLAQVHQLEPQDYHENRCQFIHNIMGRSGYRTPTENGCPLTETAFKRKITIIPGNPSIPSGILRLIFRHPNSRIFCTFPLGALAFLWIPCAHVRVILIVRQRHHFCEIMK